MKTNNITYRRVSDYNIPNLTLPPEETSVRLGKWGMLHKDYLEKALFHILCKLMKWHKIKNGIRACETQCGLHPLIAS